MLGPSVSEAMWHQSVCALAANSKQQRPADEPELAYLREKNISRNKNDKKDKSRINTHSVQLISPDLAAQVLQVRGLS